jgi:CheY-like chemotaxis protein
MRILVASSDRETRERLSALLAASGVGVIEASSLGEAIEVALIWGAAGAVVDPALEDAPGRLAAELIHRCLPSLPLVVIEEGMEIQRLLELFPSREGREPVAAAA